MNGFIQVTDKEDGFKVLLSVKQIKSIIEMDDGSTCIEMVENRKGANDIVYCRERYINIVNLLGTLNSSN